MVCLSAAELALLAGLTVESGNVAAAELGEGSGRGQRVCRVLKLQGENLSCHKAPVMSVVARMSVCDFNVAGGVKDHSTPHPTLPPSLLLATDCPVLLHS